MDQNLTQQLKSLKTVHIALMSGVLLFLFIAIYINQAEGGFVRDVSLMNIFLIASNAMSIISITGGLFVFNKRIKDVKLGETLFVKLTKYRDVMIIRSATLEASSFFFVVCFFLFGSTVFLIEAIAGLALLLFFFPTNYRIAKEIDHDIREFY
jgi:hypothetical protein